MLAKSLQVWLIRYHDSNNQQAKEKNIYILVLGHEPTTLQRTFLIWVFIFQMFYSLNKLFLVLNDFFFFKYTEPHVSNVYSTFDRGVGRRSLNSQVPRWVSLVGEIPHLQIADGEPDDGGLVQLAGDGTWQWQHLGQFIKLKVLFSPTRPCRVPWLLLPQSLQPVRNKKKKKLKEIWSHKRVVQNVIFSNHRWWE